MNISRACLTFFEVELLLGQRERTFKILRVVAENWDFIKFNSRETFLLNFNKKWKNEPAAEMKTSRNQHVYVFRKWNEKLFIPKSVIFLRYRSWNCHRLFTPPNKKFVKKKKLWNETETPCCAEICRFVTRCQYRIGYREYLHCVHCTFWGEAFNNKF